MFNRRIASISLVLVVLLCFFSVNQVEAKETEFEFYYQNIEKVVQINNPEPKGWWEVAKSFVKRGYNGILKTWDSAVGRKHFPGEGTKRWYSSEDHNIAYDVRRTKVKSEDHLLSLMGASSAEELTEGQKAMLAVYRHSKVQAIKDRMKFGYLAKMKVILSDTTDFSDSQKYPHVRRDFWPYSNGSLVQISSGRYNYPGSEADASSTFLHEFSHSMDRTIKEIITPYGKDGSHYTNELSKKRAAFVEGWAEFNEMLDSEDEVEAMKRSITKVRIEDKSVAGKYTIVSSDDESLSGMDLLSVEGINAMILYRLANELPNGKEKIFKTFASTNWKIFRSLKTFSADFARRYPADVEKLAQIIDKESKNRLSDEDFSRFIGNGSQASAYISSRSIALGSEDMVVSSSGEVASAPEASSHLFEQIRRISAQDFAFELESAFKAVANAKKAYIFAINNSLNEREALLLQEDFLAKKQFFEQLKKSRRGKTSR